MISAWLIRYETSRPDDSAPTTCRNRFALGKYPIPALKKKWPDLHADKISELDKQFSKRITEILQGFCCCSPLDTGLLGGKIFLIRGRLGWVRSPGNG